MSEQGTEDPLDQLIVNAEEERQRFNKARSRLQEVRERMRNVVGTLEEEGTLNEDDAERIRGLVDDGEYQRARDAIEDAREGGLEFEDEEKQAFARRFSESWEEMNATAEAVATALLDFEKDIDREDMVAYLYGKHSGLNKGDIRAVFDAFESVPEGGLSTREMARMLSAFNHDLNIEPTVEVLDSIKQESRR